MLGAATTAVLLAAPASPASADTSEMVTPHRQRRPRRHRRPVRVVPLRRRRGTAVFVGFAVRQGAAPGSECVGGTRVVCDGVERRWITSGRLSSVPARPGTVRVQATLMELRPQGGLPLPYVHTVRAQDVTLYGS